MPLKHLALASLMLLPVSALADWQLVGDESSVNFISVKKSNIAETHHFSGMSGKITDDGTATVKIDLASVETNIPIRNERMQKMLFNTEEFASAAISANVDASKLKSLAPGQTIALDTDLTLDIHGTEHSEKAMLQVTGLENGQLLVTTSAPVVINAGNYQLLDGIQKLREVAGLDSISPIVPVTAKLIFSKQ